MGSIVGSLIFGTPMQAPLLRPKYMPHSSVDLLGLRFKNLIYSRLQKSWDMDVG